MFKISGFSDIGRFRKSNQDAFFCAGNGRFAVVADGMGGHKGGEVASSATVTAIRTHLEKHPNEEPNVLLKESIRLANEIVFDIGKDNLQGMGTTVVMAVFQGEHAHIAAVGDSRAYITGKNRFKQITHDHTMVSSLLEIGKITQNQVSTHPQKNLLTRAVGTESSIKIDIFEEKLEKGESLLLCTDGLTNAISDFELAELLKANVSPDDLCLLANKRSGRDNCTVIICTKL